MTTNETISQNNNLDEQSRETLYRKSFLEWVLNTIDKEGNIVIGNFNCFAKIQKNNNEETEHMYDILFEVKDEDKNIIKTVKELVSAPGGYSGTQAYIINTNAQDVVNVAIVILETGGNIYE